MDCPQCHAANAEAAETCFGCGRPLGPFGLRQGAVIAARYELLQSLGSGGMGMVYKAHDRTLDETVAIKLLRPEVAGQEEMARRFQSEIKLARKVRHRNVCGIHEYGQDGELRFITMEFIPGEDLRKLLARQGALPADQAYELSLQLAEGLAAIHAAGIVHRDLKTPNIMIDAQGTAHLMDFGIAKLLDQQGTTSAGTVAGTPEYMSPEQARGEVVDFRTDVYGLGIVIFELFAGRVPFRGETPVATIFKHLQEAPPLTGVGAPRLPPALVPVLAKALAKQPSQRYQNTAELIEALKAARSGALPVPAVVAPGQGTGAFWICPKCKRHVPARVTICRCGHERVPAPAAAPQPAMPAPRARSPRGAQAVAGVAAVAACAALGFWLWPRAQPAPPPLAPRRPPAPAVADAPAPASSASATPYALPSEAQSNAPAPAAVSTPDPTPSAPAPPPSAAPAPSDDPRVSSDIDRLRESGTKSFDETMGALARRAAEWRATAARCYGASGLPAESPTITLPSVAVGSCSTTRRDLVATGDALLEAVAHAEDEARRAWIPPGTQRAIRQKHGLDQDTVERLRTAVRTLERE